MYYERLYQRSDLGGRQINDLAVHEWQFLLDNFKSSAFGMFRDEGMCNTLCSTLLGQSYFRGIKPEDLDEEAIGALLAKGTERWNLTEAQANIDSCVVGVQDDWATTKQIIWRWFPWLQFNDDFRANTGRGNAAEKRNSLRADLRERLEACNDCDIKLYEHALERFEKQRVVLGALV